MMDNSVGSTYDSNMKVLQAQDENDFIVQTNNWLKSRSHPKDLVHLPAGGTPLPIYRNWENQAHSFLKEISFQQVDEVIRGNHTGLFAQFFKDHLPSYQNQFIPLQEEPLKSQCAILGVGENGHIAFHEPEIPLNFNYGCVKLSAITKASLNLSPDSYGQTYGLEAFLKVPHLLILASGSKKASILKALLDPSNRGYIVCQLKDHIDLTLVIHPNLSELL